MKAFKNAKFLTQDSREVTDGSVFFAVENKSLGHTSDGHLHIQAALDSGAIWVVARKDHSMFLNQKNISDKIILVDSPRRSFAEMSADFFLMPSQKLSVVGITGTNGKTTLTYLVQSILNSSGLDCGIIGTIENRFKDKVHISTHTTPDAFKLQKLFSDFLNQGAKAVAIEVSSHALDQERVWGTQFSSVVFTNLTQDHLDYHGSMNEYFESKKKLFLHYDVKNRIINFDDEYGKKLIKSCESKKINFITFGSSKPNDSHLNIDHSGLQSTLKGIFGDIIVKYNKSKFKIAIESKLIGGFNIQNIAAAVSVGVALGLDPEKISRGIGIAKAVSGRMENIENSKGLLVLIDYAHTPDALEKVLITLNQLQETNTRIHVVFGCGGDRDSLKRPLMGRVTSEYANYVYVTSDNPRTEDPKKIIEDIKSGINTEKSNVEFIIDRKQAIMKAISQARAGDIVLIAGKGHETYQMIGDKKHPFDDREIARELLNA